MILMWIHSYTVLPLPREATGEEADQLLRKLPPATYAIREPPYEHDMRPLRWVFAWRKCCLDAKVKQAARIPTAIVGDLMAGSTTDEEREDEEEERVQFKVVRASGRGRKRKASSNPGSSSGASLTGRVPRNTVVNFGPSTCSSFLTAWGQIKELTEMV